MNERTYENGYQDALELMDFTITHAIKRNDDMQTPQQMLNVINAVIAELNYQIIECNTDDDDDYYCEKECASCEEKEEYEKITEEELKAIMHQIFSGFGIIEGGKNNE